MATLNGEKAKSGPIILEKDGKSVTGKEAANLLIKQYASVSDLHVDKNRKRQVHLDTLELKEKEQVHDNDHNKPFTANELDSAIKNLKIKKSPGPDQVTNEMIIHLGNRMKKKLLQLYNISWKTGTIPKAWKVATMIPIHKQGKSKDKAESYRPISLLSCLCKTMETMVNTRLMWHLESKEILIEEQAGFRKGRCTEDQITLISQSIEDGFQQKNNTVVVWVDMEKAFDRVWKKGLSYKLLKCGIDGKMHRWLNHFLSDRTARVRAQGSISQCQTIKQGVPQGSALSPTLFSIFVNDIQSTIPKGVKAALYADDLALWATEEHIGTAKIRLQEALNKLDAWTKDWLMKANAQKTTFTIFSLSTKKQKITLTMDGHQINEENNPKYLGITFDPRMTWKAQLEICQNKGIARTCLLRKLAGLKWGADTNILRKTYTGYVRPVLEYGITAWGTAAKSNIQKVNSVQNQNLRIITGGMKSTPIIQMETHAGLESLQERKDTKLLVQRLKYKAQPNSKMHPRINSLSSNRLKRTSFAKESSMLERQNETIQEIKNLTPIETHPPKPPWEEALRLKIQSSISTIQNKSEHTDKELENLTNQYIAENFPSKDWIRVFTDGSAINAVSNGGSGVYIEFPDGQSTESFIPTGTLCTNYKAELEAIQEALGILKNTLQSQPRAKVVILSDAKSVLKKLEDPHASELYYISENVRAIQKTTQSLVLQWIPGHCNITGNEKADHLARQGSELAQINNDITFQEAKTITKALRKNEWKSRHPNHNKHDDVYRMSRKNQTIVFRLRTGHNKLKYHMFRAFKIGCSDLCTCGEAAETVEHVLQDCVVYRALRENVWGSQVDMATKLYGPLEELEKTTCYIDQAGIEL